MKRALFHDDASPRLAIGLMSGTSADGIDAALVEISGCSTDTRVRLLSFLTLPFSDAARARILRVAAGDFGGTEELCLLNFYLGELSADACEAVCAQAGVGPDKGSFVGSHGQTVFHAPDAREYLGRPVRGTLQTGEASFIAERLGCPVVSDFRVRDSAAGGLGAPLVPYTEYLLYRDAQRTVGLQNIGGIGNITVLPKGCSLNDVFAFDTGPGNMVMDALAARLTEGKARFDDGGRLAAQGTVNAGLLAWMMQDPYLSAPPPQTISIRLISKAPPPKCWSVISGNITPTGMMKNHTRTASVKNQPMPGTACMAPNPSRNSRQRLGFCAVLRSGLGMRTSSRVVQAIKAPATSSSR